MPRVYRPLQKKYERLQAPATDILGQKDTYYFIDRPPKPEYVPLPPGIDKET